MPTLVREAANSNAPKYVSLVYWRIEWITWNRENLEFACQRFVLLEQRNLPSKPGEETCSSPAMTHVSKPALNLMNMKKTSDCKASVSNTAFIPPPGKEWNNEIVSGNKWNKTNNDEGLKHTNSAHDATDKIYIGSSYWNRQKKAKWRRLLFWCC